MSLIHTSVSKQLISSHTILATIFVALSSGLIGSGTWRCNCFPSEHSTRQLTCGGAWPLQSCDSVR